jgi:hypothetical protein
MPDPIASAFVNECLALRQSHPHAPALDALDLVMQGRQHRHYDLGQTAIPPSPFALVVAAAFDCMSVNEWIAFTGPNADPNGRAHLQVLWFLEVWPKFLKRYSLG